MSKLALLSPRMEMIDKFRLEKQSFKKMEFILSEMMIVAAINKIAGF